MEVFKKKILIKRLLIFTLTFTLCFNVFFNKHDEAYAFDLVITPTVMYYFVGSFLIASGIVVGQDEIANIAAHAYDEIKDLGQEAKEKIIDFKKYKEEYKPNPGNSNDPNNMGKWTLGALGTSWFMDFFNKLKNKEKDYINENHNDNFTSGLRNISLHQDSKVRHYYMSLGVLTYNSVDYFGVTEFWFQPQGMQSSLMIKQDGVDRTLKTSHSGNIYWVKLSDNAKIMKKKPSETLKDFNSMPQETPNISVPPVPNLQPNELPNINWETDKDELIHTDGVFDDNVNPDPGPDPGPDPDPNPDPQPDTLFGFLKSILDMIKNIFDWCSNFIGNLIEALINMLKSIFVPSSQLWQDTYNNLKNTLDSKFSFVGQLGEVFDVFKNYQFKEDIYKIYWPYDKVTDFAWYMPYRMRFRNIMSGLFTVIFVLGITKRNEPQVMVL